MIVSYGFGVNTSTIVVTGGYGLRPLGRVHAPRSISLFPQHYKVSVKSSKYIYSESTPTLLQTLYLNVPKSKLLFYSDIAEVIPVTQIRRKAEEDILLSLIEMDVL